MLFENPRIAQTVTKLHWSEALSPALPQYSMAPRWRELVEAGPRVILENDGRQASNDNRKTADHSGKEARSWPAMQRARNNSLMLGTLENLEAQAVLRRLRNLYDVAMADPRSLASPHGNTFADIHPFEVIDPPEEDGEPTTRPGYQSDREVRFQKSEEQLAAGTTVDDRQRYVKMRRATFRMTGQLEKSQRRNRSKTERKNDAARLSGKIRPKGGPPPYCPNFRTATQLSRVEAISELDHLRAKVGEHTFEVLTAVAYSGSTMEEIGVVAGFSGKQAEAVGLDRSRLAMAAAISAFNNLERDNEPWALEEPGPTALAA